MDEVTCKKQKTITMFMMAPPHDVAEISWLICSSSLCLQLFGEFGEASAKLIDGRLSKKRINR